MGLEVVLNEILARGAEEEQKILRQAETEKQRILDAAEGEADGLRAKALQDTRGKLDALRREQQSASEFEVRRRLLTAQRELTDDFRARILHALSTMKDADRQKLLAPLVKKAQRELPKGRIHARTEDLAFLATGNYTRGRELQTAGGFQVESEDGTLLLDYRLETLLEGSWKDILGQTRQLFEG